MCSATVGLGSEVALNWRKMGTHIEKVFGDAPLLDQERMDLSVVVERAQTGKFFEVILMAAEFGVKYGIPQEKVFQGLIRDFYRFSCPVLDEKYGHHLDEGVIEYGQKTKV